VISTKFPAVEFDDRSEWVVASFESDGESQWRVDMTGQGTRGEKNDGSKTRAMKPIRKGDKNDGMTGCELKPS